MKNTSKKHVHKVLIWMFLPIVIIMAILYMSVRHSYMTAADSFGLEFADAMTQQAQNTISLTTKENWNSLSIALAGLPDNFYLYAPEDKTSYLKALSASSSGRGCTLFYYGQAGECIGSDGTQTTMHYTSRPDLSNVLSGTEDRALYGPLYENSDDSEDTATAIDSTTERSGYVIYYSLPIRGEGGMIRGVLSLRRDAYEYCDAISDLSLGEGGYTYVVDDNNTVIAVSRNEKLAMVNQEENHTGSGLVQEQYEHAALEGTSGFANLTQKQDGIVGTVVYAPLNTDENSIDPNWAIISFVPQSDLRGYISQQAGRDIGGMLGIGLAGVLLLVLLAIYIYMEKISSVKMESDRRANAYKDILEQTLLALSGMLEARNVSRRGHGFRVAAYAREIGSHLNLSKEEQQRLYFEAALHDVGMIAVPEDVLRRQDEGTMTAEDSKIIHTHVTIGGRILGKLTDLPGINVGAMYHQQNYDGTGYCSVDATPAKGDDIPLEARIITVADMYDDLLHSKHDHIDLVFEKGKSKLFDPLLADIMIQLIRDGSIDRITLQVNDALHHQSSELTEI